MFRSAIVCHGCPSRVGVCHGCPSRVGPGRTSARPFPILHFAFSILHVVLHDTRNPSVNAELVHITTTDGLRLDGALHAPPHDAPVEHAVDAFLLLH